jgi:acyl-CoA thioesterase-1
MKENEIAVNDLHGFVLPQLEALQIPVNVHFSPEGSKALAARVASSMRRAMSQSHTDSGETTNQK